MPSRPVFEELLNSMADPNRALEGGFITPSLSLAVRAQAWGFIPAGGYDQKEVLSSISRPMQDLTLSELPVGHKLASLLALGPDGDQVRLRDLGSRLGAKDGRLQQGLNTVIDFLGVPRPALAASAGAAAVGLLHQFGTKPATGLGIPLTLRRKLLGGRLFTTVSLSSERHFENARADILARLQLPPLHLPWSFVHLDQLEVGGAAVRTTAEGLLLDTRYANLRGRLSWLNLCLGMQANHTDPGIWTVLDAAVQRDRFSVHTVLSHQWATAHSRLLATATLRTGPVMSGFFLGSQEDAKRSIGVIGMGWF